MVKLKKSKLRSWEMATLSAVIIGGGLLPSVSHAKESTVEKQGRAVGGYYTSWKTASYSVTPPKNQKWAIKCCSVYKKYKVKQTRQYVMYNVSQTQMAYVYPQKFSHFDYDYQKIGSR